MPIYPDKKEGKLTGRWRVEVQLGSRRIRKRYNSYEEAKVAEDELKDALKRGDGTESVRRSTVPVTLLEALKTAPKAIWHGQRSAPESEAKLEFIFKTLGTLSRINDIKQNSVDKLVEKLSNRKLSDATINRYLSTLSSFLKWASDRGYYNHSLPKMPWRDEKEGRIRWITAAEEYALMDLLPPDIAKLVRAAIRTGMRREEILSLEMGQLQDGKVHLWKTKSGYPRTIPVSSETFADLSYLVSTKAMPNAVALRRHWQSARKAMGLLEDRHFVFHACRHTCATRLVQANVNIRVIKEFMGHRSIETTLRYAHVNDNLLTDAMEKLEAHSETLKVAYVDTSPTRGIAPSPLTCGGIN